MSDQLDEQLDAVIRRINADDWSVLCKAGPAAADLTDEQLAGIRQQVHSGIASMERGEFTTFGGPHGLENLPGGFKARGACSSHKGAPADSSRVHLSLAAERDLVQIYMAWAQSGGLVVADRLLPGVVNHFWLLRDVPGASQPADLVGPGIRFCAAGRFLIYYRQSGRGIEILHLFHGTRNQRT